MYTYSDKHNYIKKSSIYGILIGVSAASLIQTLHVICLIDIPVARWQNQEEGGGAPGARALLRRECKITQI